MYMLICLQYQQSSIKHFLRFCVNMVHYFLKMKTLILLLVLVSVSIVGASIITGCSSPNVVLNALPKDTSISRLVAGKSLVLLVQPNAAPVPDENGYYDNGQGYGSLSGSGGAGSGGVSGAQMERRKETVNERIMESCDSEIIADGGMISHQLTDSASSAALLAGNCSGLQADYAILMNGQVLNFQSAGGGGKGGGHHRGGGSGGGGGYPGGGGTGGGGYPAGGMQENMPTGADGSGDSYQQGMGGGNGGSGTVTFWVTLVRISDCKKIFLGEAKPDGFKLSDRAESLAQIRSYLKDVFDIEGKK